MLWLFLSEGATTISSLVLLHPFIAVFTACVITLVYYAVYNRYFHPLSHVPGPFWGSITDVYNTCLFGTRQVHLEMWKLHEHYGPFVRIAPNLVSFDDPTLLPLIYHRHAEKTPFYSTGMAGEIPPLLQTEEDKTHAAKLKVLSPTYSMQRIRQMEDIVDERILKICEVFRTRFEMKNKAVDIAEWTSSAKPSRWHVYDTVTQLIYGQPVGMVEEGRDVDELVLQWHRIFTLGGLVATLPWLVHPIIRSWPLKTFLMPRKGHRSGSGHVMKAHEKLFKHRFENPQFARPGNYFDSFLRTKNVNGLTMTPEEAEHECFILTVGSQDTSAAFISAFINYIVQNPGAQSKLIAEIERFEEGGLLTSPVVRYDETASMPYFMACCQETLRLSPSVSMVLPRYAPEMGMEICGRSVSNKEELAANPYVLHRNKHVFGMDAEDFCPERWLGDPAHVKQMAKYLLSFGYGSRRCLGKNIALFESQKFCLQLFREFHIQSSNPERPLKQENWGILIYFDQFIQLNTRRPQGPCELP